MTVTIILPTYNEAENIAPLIAKIRRELPLSTILVVDDNSPDRTAQKVKTNAQTKVLVRTKNRGLTNSLRDGIAYAHTDLIGWMDCDFSHPPHMLPKLYNAVGNGADIAIAERRTYSMLSTIINRISQIFFGGDIKDYTSGFLIAKRSVLTTIPITGYYGEYCIDLLVRAKRKGFRIEQVLYDSPPRTRGASKTSLKYGMGYLLTVWNLLWTSDR